MVAYEIGVSSSLVVVEIGESSTTTTIETRMSQDDRFRVKIV